MATITWPVGLPQKPSPQGYRDQPRDNAIRTAMEVGPPKQRRRSTGEFELINMVITVDRTQSELLDTFYNNTSEHGTLPFDWIHPRKESAREFRFRKPPVFRALGGLEWQAVLELEVQPLNLGIANFPMTLSGLRAWHRSDLNVFADVAGCPIDAAQRIYTWGDISGNGLDWIQATRANRMIYQLDQMNGRPGIVANGVSNYMQGDTKSEWAFLNDGTDWTMWVVTSFNNSSGIASIVDSGGSDDTKTGFYLNNDFSAAAANIEVTRSVGAAKAIVISPATIGLATPYALVATNEVDVGGDDGEIFIDNTSAVTDDKLNPYAATDPSDFATLGALSTGLGGFFKGPLMELGFKEGVMTTDEKNDLADYIEARYAIAQA